MYTQDEANLLTPEGFAEYVQGQWNNGLSGLTHVDAYEAAEALRQRVHKRGKRAYNDFESYRRRHKQYLQAA